MLAAARLSARRLALGCTLHMSKTIPRSLLRNLVLLLIPSAIIAAPQSGTPQSAIPQRSLTFEDILRWKIASAPRISPDGKKIAFLLSENNLEKSKALMHLWWVDTETKQTRRLTHLDEVVADHQWSPDGRWLGFISGRTVDGNAKSQVWLLPVDGGEAFPITRGPEDVEHWRWSPDSKSIYFVAAEPQSETHAAWKKKQQEQKIDTVTVDADRARNQIFRVSTATQVAEIIFAGDLGLSEIWPSPDGKWLLYSANRTGDPDHESAHNLWLLDLATRAVKPLVERGGQERSVVWSSDSSRIAFLAPRDEKLRYSQEEIFTMPIASLGVRPEPARLSKEFVGSAESLHWPAGNTLWFAAAVGAGNRVFALNAADGSVRATSNPAVFLTDVTWTPDGSAAAGLVESPTSLPEIAYWRNGTAQIEPQTLTTLNPQLKEFALGAQEVVRWKSRDGKEIEGVLIRPVGYDPTKKYPLLLDIHGGPYGRRSNTLNTGNLPQAWAARGWLVLQPNFRGSSGYGHEFGLGNRGDIGGRDYEDIISGVDFAIAQGWADPQRLAVMGESYGGYMTNWIIGHTQRFRAAVSAFGLFSLFTDFSNSSYPSWETDYLAKFYWEDFELYMNRSPQKFVQQMQTPVLILHGDADDNTFISNSKEMYQALKLLGRTVKFVRFPREGHGFTEPQHVLARFRETASWLETHTPGFATDARAAVEGVTGGGWELRVVETRIAENYAGVKPKGKFVEVTLLLRNAARTDGRYSVLVFDNAGGDVSLNAAGRTFYPEGIVSETLGQKLLAKSSSQVLAAQPESPGTGATLAFMVAFDLPADVREVTLRIKDFPPIKLTLW